MSEELPEFASSEGDSSAADELEARITRAQERVDAMRQADADIARVEEANAQAIADGYAGSPEIGPDDWVQSSDAEIQIEGVPVAEAPTEA